ncbi:oxidoreductase [Kibdelosporangium phytohabitans]|uniref:Protochlorophyllide oxidoreductase n=1 Tax=Kibdelosporangium phytohabitans TaxID=860235 RepID=A0A0N9HZV1_9PSEU|nr:oxidoreductase [Kibdelosporangium phytohabitans]ALG07757.1 protochlorophyllide oxidoreductase [Kibdelosporangium phytohabitans]MBE1471330.1 NAD(P)-dependent dehydrogenase (short-subunit alcohol dehydrogenase family) [Kibdelosporangium phytohabitans]
MAHWSEADIPDQTGRTALVTGANSGLGLRSAKVLAGMGARVLVASRDPERGRGAVAAVGRNAELVELDLADLASVRKAATRVRELTGDKLDILMNNAGVMGTPFSRTADGFETQFGVNHLGHAALTWLLMPAIKNGRVVTVTSLAARAQGLDLDDPNFERRRYSIATGYSQSKLANLIFMVELGRRAEAAGLTLVSTGGHPGMAATNLVGNSVRLRDRSIPGEILDWGMRRVLPSAAAGALPQLYAATAPDVRNGDFFGPKWALELFGPPVKVRLRAAATNETLGRRLWDVTAELTGVTPDF